MGAAVDLLAAADGFVFDRMRRRGHCCAVRDGNAITDEHFCLTIGSHMIFVRDWDEKFIAQWESIENTNAIISKIPRVYRTFDG